MTDARKRIEELEEALNDLCLNAAILYQNVVGCIAQHQGGGTAGSWLLHAKASIDAADLLLSEQTETPVEETGDVERVATDSINRALASIGAINLDDYDEPLSLHQCAEIITAMRPVSVDREKLSEIRARHDSVADMADDEWDNRIYTIADDAFSDRAFLLSVIEGVSHE